MPRKKKMPDPSLAAPPQESAAVVPASAEEQPPTPAVTETPAPVAAEAPAAEPVAAAPEATESALTEPEAAESEPESAQAPAAPAPRLERLQKILAAAGIASRRHAEELIAAGRVQVNGETVTRLGTKADPARDHIRVDGKLLRGPERLRYFALNKPRGYVTTVSDPEGRPTVMEFFARTGERLYPVGRLDYQSEGLLLVTNDGDLANRLTQAAAGVEKTYLVKVSGQPADEALDRLREGVSIERGQPGQGKVRAAPARIRQVREGDNPWFEVVLVEGRNRELRKMFEEIGHHVEKIRRVGYGPLVLDVPPGKLRELEPEEVEALRLAAAGKLKPRRLKTKRMLPRDAGKPVVYGEKKPPQERQAARPERAPRSERGVRSGRREDRPDRPRRFDRRAGASGGRAGGFEKPFRHREDRGERAPDEGRSFAPRGEEFRPRRGGNPRFGRPEGGRTGNRRDDRGDRPGESGRKPFRPRSERRPFDRDEAEAPRRFERGSGRPPARRFADKPGNSRSKSGPREGSAPSFRGKSRPAGKSGFGGRSKPAQSGFKKKGGAPARAGGFKARPRPSGGKRVSGSKRKK